MEIGLALDTDQAAQAVQDGVYRTMTGAGRVAIAYRLSAAARQLTVDGIRRRHPGYRDDEVFIALMRIVHGDAVVREVWPNRLLVQP